MRHRNLKKPAGDTKIKIGDEEVSAVDNRGGIHRFWAALGQSGILYVRKLHTLSDDVCNHSCQFTQGL